jgi:AraC family transcriptional regulator
LRAAAKIAATDSQSTTSGIARGDSLDRLWLDVSLTWVEGSKNFDEHCPTVDGHHLMVYTLSGTGRLFQRQGKRELRADFAAGSVMIRPAGSSERVYGAVPERLRVGVSERLVVESMAQIGGAGTVDLVPELNVNDPVIRHGASILWAELVKPLHPAQGLLVEGVATMLAAQLLRNYDARSRPRDDPVRRLDPAALRSVMGYMHDHVAEHITLDELSRLAGASRFRFVRRFRASTGMTPMRYLESCRIELARKLLREGNRSMAEIAVAVGFADQSLFVKRFRRHAGCTPGQYATQVGGWTDIRDTVQAALAHTPAQSPAPRHAGE